MGMFEKPHTPCYRAEQQRKQAVGVKGNGENLDCYTWNKYMRTLLSYMRFSDMYNNS